MSLLTILAAFACDDVRQETQGKHTFVGVLNPSFSLTSLPSAIRLWFVLVVRSEGAGTERLNLRLRDQGGGVLAGGEGLIELQREGGALTIPLGPFPLHFEAPTVLSLEFKNGDEWSPIQTWEVTGPAAEPAVRKPRARKDPAKRAASNASAGKAPGAKPAAPARRSKLGKTS